VRRSRLDRQGCWVVVGDRVWLEAINWSAGRGVIAARAVLSQPAPTASCGQLQPHPCGCVAGATLARLWLDQPVSAHRGRGRSSCRGGFHQGRSGSGWERGWAAGDTTCTHHLLPRWLRPWGLPTRARRSVSDGALRTPSGVGKSSLLKYPGTRLAL